MNTGEIKGGPFEGMEVSGKETRYLTGGRYLRLGKPEMAWLDEPHGVLVWNSDGHWDWNGRKPTSKESDDMACCYYDQMEDAGLLTADDDLTFGQFYAVYKGA